MQSFQSATLLISGGSSSASIFNEKCLKLFYTIHKSQFAWLHYILYTWISRWLMMERMWLTRKYLSHVACVLRVWLCFFLSWCSLRHNWNIIIFLSKISNYNYNHFHLFWPITFCRIFLLINPLLLTKNSLTSSPLLWNYPSFVDEGSLFPNVNSIIFGVKWDLSILLLNYFLLLSDSSVFPNVD